jgi:hypothetical protein
VHQLTSTARSTKSNARELADGLQPAAEGGGLVSGDAEVCYWKERLDVAVETRHRRVTHRRLSRESMNHQLESVRTQDNDRVVGGADGKVGHGGVEIRESLGICGKDDCTGSRVAGHEPQLHCANSVQHQAYRLPSPREIPKARSSVAGRLTPAVRGGA